MTLEIGSLAAIESIEKEIHFQDIVDDVVPKREQGMSVGQYGFIWMGLRWLLTEVLRASYLLTSNGKDEIIQCRYKMHLKGACFLSRQWGDPRQIVYPQALRIINSSVPARDFHTSQGIYASIYEVVI